MKIKFDRNSWYIKLLGTPESWCGLAWGLTWRAAGLFAAYWVLYLLAVGNYHLFFSEEESQGWFAVGIITDLIVLYIGFAIGCIQRKEIKAWVKEHCPKLEYEDETQDV